MVDVREPSNYRYKLQQIIGGKYKVIERLGQGGMGAVYRVEQVFIAKQYALKVLDSEQHSEIAVRRFQQEAKAAASLCHPNLVQVHDFGLLDDGQPFLVMDCVEGITLSERLKENGPLSTDQAVDLFMQVCSGLQFAHSKSVVHRDIKPSNIMLVSGESLTEPGSVKILDFGIAKVLAGTDIETLGLTRTGEVIGSPLYMSPEQCQGLRVDQRSDIYSLGCVMYESLTGAPPHMGANALTTMMLHQSTKQLALKSASLGKDFPIELENLVEKMLNKSPEDRYQSISSVTSDLLAISRSKLDAKWKPTPQMKAQNDALANKAGSQRKSKPLMLSGKKFGVIILASIAFTGILAGTAGYLLREHRAPITDGKLKTSAAAAEPEKKPEKIDSGFPTSESVMPTVNGFQRSAHDRRAVNIRLQAAREYLHGKPTTPETIKGFDESFEWCKKEMSLALSKPGLSPLQIQERKERLAFTYSIEGACAIRQDHFAKAEDDSDQIEKLSLGTIDHDTELLDNLAAMNLALAMHIKESRQSEELKKSAEFFQRAARFYHENNKLVEEGSALFEAGHIQIEKLNRPTEAADCLLKARTSLATAGKTDTELYCSNLIELGKALRAQHHYADAMLYYNEARPKADHFYETNAKKVQLVEDCYRGLADSEIQMGYKVEGELHEKKAESYERQSRTGAAQK